MKKDIHILAVETSCDETAAAVVRNGREICSNIIFSQIDLHKLYGGVVPEIASRKHIEKINQVIEAALKEAGMKLDEMDAVFVNGQRLDEPYVSENALGETDLEYPYQVPEDRWFVMGDHRSVSLDSRTKAIGPIAEEQIIGKLVTKLWPPASLGGI